MTRLSNFIFCFLLSGVSISNAAVIKEIFEIYYVSGSPDGVSTSSILSINGQFPAPTIHANEGDTVEITILNKIQDKQNATIHWHGLHQKGSLFEDGTSQIAQCPLPYGSFQVYRFQVKHSGTYWYHSHVQSQYTEGLLGALIVHSTDEPYHYDGELTLILHDWYHRSAHENEAWYLSPSSSGLTPFPDSSLINGYGRYSCDFASLQNRSCSALSQRRQIFSVQQNTTYRVRIINAAAVSFFNFSIDSHTLHTIEVDSIDLANPVPVDIATIAPGQRYSFLVHTKPIAHGSNEEQHKFLIRSILRSDLLRARTDTTENINLYPEALYSESTAVMHPVRRDLGAYSHLVQEETQEFSYNEILPPRFFDEVIYGKDEEYDESQIRYLNQLDLLPLDGIPAPDYFDEEFILSAGQTVIDGVTHASFNGTPFRLPHDKPLLFSLLEDGTVPEGAFPLEIKAGSVVQVVINSRGNHPFHLHGHHFWVVGVGQPEDQRYDPTVHELNTKAMKRDTVVATNWVVIRFIADNPGIWTLHCHFDWHNLGGMALTFVEGTDILRQTVEPTEEARRVCSLHQ